MKASNNNTVKPLKKWNIYEKVIFRFFAIYFLVLVLPIDWKFYQELFSIQWGSLNYGDTFSLARYTTRFFSAEPSFWDWGIAAAIAIVGTGIWTLLEKKDRDYHRLYYLLRVVLRYRLSLAVIAYGFIKLFPIQSPYPSISHLNTDYGDFTTWKLFSLSLGVVPSYEVFLGLVELVAGILLLFKRTTTIGAFIIISFTGNVVLSNLAYEGGEVVYSLFLVSIALFLVVYDLPRLYQLLAVEKPTAPNLYRPVYITAATKNVRLVLKSGFAFFIVLVGYLTYAGYSGGVTKYPVKAGLAEASGLYNVKTISIGGDTLSYSAQNPLRWKDVVFEKWNTISVRDNRTAKIVDTNVEYVANKESERLYEVEGTSGRHYYSYEIDHKNEKIHLQNRNPFYENEKWTFHFERPDPTSIILSGEDHEGKDWYVELERIDKRYLIKEAAKQGRREKLSL
jgi:uncharacterized membrane protein YphA (DoxX/SURF4 family)